MSKLTDEEIMIKVKAGKVEMLAILFERHHVKLYNFILRLTGKRNISEDLAQEVFYRILKYRETFELRCRFTYWMYRIARNAFIDHLRKEKPEYSLDEVWQEAATPEPAPDEKLGKEQEHVLLHRALARLSVKKREVILLSRFQNLKYGEIAEILDCSIESVKVLVHRGIKDLRKNFMELTGGSA